MLAKQLAYQLMLLCRSSDVTTDSMTDMDQRFEALRGHGRLPRGRENRGRQLSNEQIAAAILGLAASRPGWTGHVVAITEKLRPVGGSTEFFGGAINLTDALCAILSDSQVREELVSVRLSVAEAGVNAHGQAVITVEHSGERKQIPFVHLDAVSLLQPGAHFDAEKRFAPVSRELVLNRRFFQQLAREIDDARARPSPVIADGAEYDREEAQAARRKRLGVTSSSSFLHVGVDNQVTWPKEEMLIQFDRYSLVLMPKSKEHVQSVHIDLDANRLSHDDAMTVINRFLSLLTWCDDQYAIVEGGWAGNPVPVAVSKRNLAFATTHCWLFNRSIPTSKEELRALALYREARNAEQNFMISYAVLSYFKVLEVRYPEGKVIRPWIAKTFPLIQQDIYEGARKAFLEACGEEPVEEYLWKACRVAVAHVREKHPSDPDDAHELRRLDRAADVMRWLARHFIREELGVSDSPFGSSMDETRVEQAQ